MKIKNVLAVALISLMAVSCINDEDHLGNWRKGNQFPGKSRWASVSFQIGDKIYVGLGQDDEGYELNDFWCATFVGDNQSDLDWKQVANSFPGAARHGAVAFVIGNNAYVGTGYRGAIDASDEQKVYYKDFYKFDGTTETWEQIDDFMGGPRYNAVAFTLNGKGYVGTGYVGKYFGVADGVLKTFYVYEENVGWSPMTPDFSGDARQGAITFVWNNRAYVCLGTDYDTSEKSSVGNGLTDVLYFDGTRWVACGTLSNKTGQTYDNDYPDVCRHNAACFIADDLIRGERVYVVGGNKSTAWSYEPSIDRWSQVSSKPSASALERPIAFSNPHKTIGFVTTGSAGSSYTSVTKATLRFFPGWRDKDDDNDDLSDPISN